MAVAGLPAVAAVLVHAGRGLSLATPVLVVLTLVIVVALIGGARPAVPAAVVGGLTLNYWFTPPLHQLSIDSTDHVLVLAVYLAVAVAVSVVVDLANRRTAEAARAKAEAEALSSVAGSTLGEQETLPALLDRVRIVFGAHQVALVDDLDVPLAVVGGTEPDDVEQSVPAGAARLVVRGPALFAEDRRVLQAFAEAAATALEGRRLAQQASAAEAVDRMRTALLAAAGHDLRTPLAGVKAAVSSLRQDDIAWTAEETAELLATIEDSADRLQGLVSNLLDASRLQAGALSVSPGPVGLDEVVARALVGTAGRDRVRVDVPESLPPVLADAGLLERVIANLVDNALRHDDGLVTVQASGAGFEVVDHGPGLAQLPDPFTSDRGVGLGLFVVRGFVEAMGGTVTPTDTPGGGLTMRVVLLAC
ncbi:MAG: Histidine kinase, gyrase and HSP90-like ATPase [Frankiales bacterium]|nr:Histidine kinase, gyrase and HSP90-like ATPase [Frankiales bacterium]